MPLIFFGVFMKVKALKLFYYDKFGTIAKDFEFDCDEIEARSLINDGYLKSLDVEIKPKKEENLQVKPLKNSKKQTKKVK